MRRTSSLFSASLASKLTALVFCQKGKIKQEVMGGHILTSYSQLPSSCSFFLLFQKLILIQFYEIFINKRLCLKNHPCVCGGGGFRLLNLNVMIFVFNPPKLCLLTLRHVLNQVNLELLASKDSLVNFLQLETGLLIMLDGHVQHIILQYDA